VDTPILTTNDCEGGGEAFRVRPAAADAAADSKDEFFGRPTYLTVSGQLQVRHTYQACLRRAPTLIATRCVLRGGNQAELLASALTRVFTLGPTFRAGAWACAWACACQRYGRRAGVP
jgi:asparaginyl-tRNA synthetase